MMREQLWISSCWLTILRWRAVVASGVSTVETSIDNRDRHMHGMDFAEYAWQEPLLTYNTAAALSN